MVEFPEPGAGTGLGLKVIVPMPVPDKVIAELKPPNTAPVIVAVPGFFLDTVTVVGDTLMLKLFCVPNSALIRLDWFGLPQPVAKS